MAQNIFEEQLHKKQKMSFLITKADEFGWINAAEKADFLCKMDNDILTIGVIGQMKAGKSTFLNSFVFEDNVLPAATTPMTAALSVITYGAEKKLMAEFYSADEWEEQKMTAAMLLEDTTDELQKSKIRAAKELVEKSAKLGNRLSSLLGKTQEDSFENLEEYVGADGQYVSITKSVNILYPMEALKGVNIVDTPGFNDPIVSREERTKEFLKKADVVLLMLYAGRPFDAIDRGILFKNVGECGIGKVLIGINKYDIPYESGETEDEIRAYVKKEIRKAGEIMGDLLLNDILRETEPIPLSAEMALLSELPMNKISSIDNFSHSWKRACDTFEISSQKEMREKSHLDDLVQAIKQVIEKEKDVILFKKPTNAILAKGNNLKTRIEEDIITTTNEISILQAPDDELEEKESKLARVTRRLNKKIDGLGDDLDITFEEIVRKGHLELEDAVDSCCRKMNGIVDAWGRFSGPEGIAADLDRELKFLGTRTLKRICDNIATNAKTKVKKTLDGFFMESEDILQRLPLDDFDPRNFVKSTSYKINFNNANNELFRVSEDNEDEENDGWGDVLLGFVDDFINGYTLGLSHLLGNAFTHNEIKAEIEQWISNIQCSFDAKEYLNHIYDSKDKIIKEVKKAFMTELLDPLQKQLEDVRKQGVDKEAKLAEAKSRLETLKNQLSTIKKQIEEINSL